MRNKNVIRLTESKLHRIIAESVKRVLRETSSYYDDNSNSIFIDCNSPINANFVIELNFTDYSDIPFYVGNVSNGYEALSKIISFFDEKNEVIENYSADEEEFLASPNQYIEVDGLFFNKKDIHIKKV